MLRAGGHLGRKQPFISCEVSKDDGTAAGCVKKNSDDLHSSFIRVRYDESRPGSQRARASALSLKVAELDDAALHGRPRPDFSDSPAQPGITTDDRQQGEAANRAFSRLPALRQRDDDVIRSQRNADTFRR